jgi:hypothetical protein
LEPKNLSNPTLGFSTHDQVDSMMAMEGRIPDDDVFLVRSDAAAAMTLIAEFTGHFSVLQQQRQAPPRLQHAGKAKRGGRGLRGAAAA